jgi:tRNA/tmRNA/rRNA uracil-C5-methylase (TrmA/RlmC/RlmD family)
MARKLKEKLAPEIVSGLRLQEMAYGGEVVARLGEKGAAPNGGPAEPDELPEGAEEGDFQPLNEPVETELVTPPAPAGSQVVFVTGGLPGETVEVQLYRRKKSFIKANVRHVEQASPDRREAPCPYFGVDKWPNCGGCQWQHADYAAQLTYKHNILRDQMVRLGGFVDREPPLLPPLAAVSPWGYRNNVEFQVDEHEGRPCFHRQNSIRLVPVQSCHISHPLITLAIEPLTRALQKHLPKRVHQVTVRVGGVSGDAPISAEEIAALASYSEDSTRKLAALERFLAVGPLEMALERPRPAMLLVLRMLGEWQRSDLQPFLEELQGSLDRYVELTVVGEGRKRRLEAVGGDPFITESLDGVTYRVPPLAFFQSNSPMAVELVREALGAFGEAGLNLRGKRLLDIYCGVGTFALQMARRGAKVLGIEEYAGAVEGAAENARLNGLEDQCRFVAAKAEEYILELEAQGEHYDAALVDPPRRGCDPALLHSLLKTRPPVLVYVSCDPSTLARDIKILSEGYELVRCRAVDMFPQTYHMESVVLMLRKDK